MSFFALFASFEYLCNGSTAIIHILVLLVRGPTLDVRFVLYRRQIMTSKVGPRPEGSTYQQNCWNLANSLAFQRQMLEIWNVWVYFRYLNLFTIQGYSENVGLIIRCSSLFSSGNSQKWLFVTILWAVTVSRSMNILMRQTRPKYPLVWVNPHSAGIDVRLYPPTSFFFTFRPLNLYNAESFLYKPWRPKVFFNLTSSQMS